MPALCTHAPWRSETTCVSQFSQPTTWVLGSNSGHTALWHTPFFVEHLSDPLCSVFCVPKNIRSLEISILENQKGVYEVAFSYSQIQDTEFDASFVGFTHRSFTFSMVC